MFGAHFMMAAERPVIFLPPSTLRPSPSFVPQSLIGPSIAPNTASTTPYYPSSFFDFCLNCSGVSTASQLRSVSISPNTVTKSACYSGKNGAPLKVSTSRTCFRKGQKDVSPWRREPSRRRSSLDPRRYAGDNISAESSSRALFIPPTRRSRLATSWKRKVVVKSDDMVDV